MVAAFTSSSPYLDGPIEKHIGEDEAGMLHTVLSSFGREDLSKIAVLLVHYNDMYVRLLTTRDGIVEEVQRATMDATTETAKMITDAVADVAPPQVPVCVWLDEGLVVFRIRLLPLTKGGST
jgi:hypothetical protein